MIMIIKVVMHLPFFYSDNLKRNPNEVTLILKAKLDSIRTSHEQNRSYILVSNLVNFKLNYIHALYLLVFLYLLLFYIHGTIY